jgi:UDP-N-acetyl-D-glucosamine dehydrogenase
MRKHHFDKASVTFSAEGLQQYDLVLIATNHDAFDYNLVLKNAKLIVDTRGVYREPAPNLIKA